MCWPVTCYGMLTGKVHEKDRIDHDSDKMKFLKREEVNKVWLSHLLEVQLDASLKNRMAIKTD